MKRSWFCSFTAIVFVFGSASAQTACADLEVHEWSSLEWMVDSSDAIAVVEELPSDVQEKPLNGESVARQYRPVRIIKRGKLLGDASVSPPKRQARTQRGMVFLREQKGGLVEFDRVDFSTTDRYWEVSADNDDNYKRPGKRILALDKKGAIVSSSEDLIRLAEARIRSGFALPADCQRKAVEDGTPVRGGFRIGADEYRMEGGSDGIVYLLVPVDPEFRQDAEKVLAQPEGVRTGPFVGDRECVRAILRENYQKREPAAKTAPVKTKKE